MLSDKENFLKNECIPLLNKLVPGGQGNWGKMDSQQMVEHLRDICKLANGKILLPLLNTEPEKLAQARAFLMTEDLFKENTRVPVMPEEPKPHKYASLKEAIAKTQTELESVFSVYTTDPTLQLMHPMFGELNYTEQIHYLYKHIRHHMRQFGLVE